MVSTKAKIFTLLSVFTAVAYYQIKEVVEVYGFFKRAKPYDGRGNCRIIPGPEACEDVVIHHRSGYAFAACGSIEGRRAHWWAPLANFRNQSYPLREVPWVYDIEKNTLSPMVYKDFPVDADVSLHGLGIYDDPENPDNPVLFLINHRRTGSVIEVFEHTIGTRELRHLETVEHPLISTPNDVVPVSRNSFYLTNDYWHKEGIWRTIELYTRRSWGNVVFHSSATNVTRVAAEGIAYANGIATNWDKSQVYVSSLGDGQLVVYNRRKDDRLVFAENIYIGEAIDNVSVDEATGHLYLAGHPNGLVAKAYLDDHTGTAPRPASTIYRISNNTSEDRFYGKKYVKSKVFEDDGTHFWTVTTAAVDNKRDTVLLGAVYMEGLIRCELADMVRQRQL